MEPPPLGPLFGHSNRTVIAICYKTTSAFYKNNTLYLYSSWFTALLKTSSTLLDQQQNKITIAFVHPLAPVELHRTLEQNLDDGASVLGDVLCWSYTGSLDKVESLVMIALISGAPITGTMVSGPSSLGRCMLVAKFKDSITAPSSLTPEEELRLFLEKEMDLDDRPKEDKKPETTLIVGALDPAAALPKELKPRPEKLLETPYKIITTIAVSLGAPPVPSLEELLKHRKRRRK